MNSVKLVLSIITMLGLKSTTEIRIEITKTLKFFGTQDNTKTIFIMNHTKIVTFFLIQLFLNQFCCKVDTKFQIPYKSLIKPI